MSSQAEDTMYESYQEVTQNGLQERFNKQLKKMLSQDKHKWKTMCEKWEYALRRIKE